MLGSSSSKGYYFSFVVYVQLDNQLVLGLLILLRVHNSFKFVSQLGNAMKNMYEVTSSNLALLKNFMHRARKFFISNLLRGLQPFCSE